MRRIQDMRKSHPKLKPRDAIHAGVCLNKQISRLYSDDPDFDSIPDIVRIPLADRSCD